MEVIYITLQRRIRTEECWASRKALASLSWLLGASGVDEMSEGEGTFFIICAANFKRLGSNAENAICYTLFKLN